MTPAEIRALTVELRDVRDSLHRLITLPRGHHAAVARDAIRSLQAIDARLAELQTSAFDAEPVRACVCMEIEPADLAEIASEHV